MKNLRQKFIISATVAAASLFVAAAPASAQSWASWRSGINSGVGAFMPSGGMFTSYFASGTVATTDMRYDTRNRVPSTSERVSLRWNGNSALDDYVAGVGWQSGSSNKTRTISYKVNSFSKTSNSTPASGLATVGAYGWLCPELGGGSQRVEYYIVDTWLAYNSAGSPTRFVPFMGASRGSANISGNMYDLYVTPSVSRGHGCGAGSASFIQLWAVRQSQTNTTADRSISMTNFFAAWSGKKLRNSNNTDSTSDISLSANAGYLIVGMEGFGRTRGELDITVKR